MATGANDPMLSEARMRSMDPAGRVFAGCGHNGHVERPDLVWDWVESVIR
jgi:pimeloyl-ACP methyl ester carboxylesterase